MRQRVTIPDTIIHPGHDFHFPFEYEQKIRYERNKHTHFSYVIAYFLEEDSFLHQDKISLVHYEDISPETLEYMVAYVFTHSMQNIKKIELWYNRRKILTRTKHKNGWIDLERL